MRIVKILALVVALMGIGGTANAATFDGTDSNPEFMTGITEVYAVSNEGIELYIPVYSLPECVEEDGTGDPCVWIAHQRGNLIGQSFVQLGTEDNRIFANVSPWAAEILSNNGGFVSEVIAPIVYEAQATPIVNEVAPTSFETVAPVAEPVQEMTTEELGMTVSEYEATTVVDAEQDIVSNDPDNLDDIISDIHADKTGVNTDHETLTLCELEEC